MPTFRVKNLSVTLGEAGARADMAALTPQLCLFPTQNCFTPTPNCPTISQWTCWTPTPQTCWIFTPRTCFTPSPQTCWTISPDTCGAISPVCDISLTPTILDTIKTTTPVIAMASEQELEAIRQDLDRVIELGRERGAQFGQGARPQTREEVDMLERELRAALEEVQKMKENLG